MFFAKHRKSGFTLLETLISTGAFAVVLGTLFVVVKIGSNSWLQVQSQRSAQVMLRNVEVYMLDDLRRASASQIRTKKLLIDGKEIQVLWFLSAMGYDDNTKMDRTAVFTRKVTGEPVWKRNIIYYLTPIGDKLHEARYHNLCTGKEKSHCPHNMLIRKEVVWPGDTTGKDFKEATLLTDDGTSGGDLAPIENFIPTARLDSLDFSKAVHATNDNFSETARDNVKLPGCKSMICVAECIQDFQVKKMDGSTADNATVGVTGIKQYGVAVSLTAFNHEEASRNVNATVLGKEAAESGDAIWEDSMSAEDREKYLSGRRYLLKYNFRVMPNN